jgi:acetyltransferase-like isoleucine patch superfamily enzyme
MKGALKHMLHWVSMLMVSPLVLAYKVSRSESVFASQGQLLSLIPGKTGSYLRVSYYAMTLDACSRNAYIGFGSFFAHPHATVGKGVYVGAYCVLGMAHIGDHTTIGSGVHILSGKMQHGFEEIGKPIQEQPG